MDYFGGFWSAVTVSLHILLSRELSGLSFPEIATRYKRISYKTVASSVFRFKEKIRRNTKIKKTIYNVKAGV